MENISQFQILRQLFLDEALALANRVDARTCNLADVAETDALTKQADFLCVLLTHIGLTLTVALLASNLAAIGSIVLIAALDTFTDGLTLHPCDLSKYGDKELAHWVHLSAFGQCLDSVVLNVETDA